MLESSRDQATDYMTLLLDNCDGTQSEKFQLLRQIAVTVAGDKIYREAIVGKSEVDAQMLKYYLERVEIDLIVYKGSIATKLTKEMMTMTHFGSVKKLNKKQTEARAKAVAKALKKNIVLGEIGVFSAEDCGKLYKAIKAESVNVYNTYWHMNLNKDHSIPSGKQLVSLLNAMRLMAFDKKDIKRISFLKANRLKVKIKKETMKVSTEELKKLKEDSDSEDDPEDDKNSEGEEIIDVDIEVCSYQYNPLITSQFSVFSFCFSFFIFSLFHFSFFVLHVQF